MDKPKFVIITSQFWDEGHIFVCEYGDDFINNAKSVVEQLENYKREKENTKDYYYGDLNYFDENNIRRRYNLNDSGDIYFITAYSVKELLDWYNYQLEEIKTYKRNARGRRSNRIIEACKEHHKSEVIKEIIESKFKLVE